ncbi:MAG: hypothetical protein GXP33_03975 [Spirochaetes bacterium]|nr:hypothetical protein [Spirochaetota bacterium]
MVKNIFFCILFIFSLTAGYSERLSVNVWWELEPMVSLEGEYPVPKEVAIKKLLEEARIFLSSMIYGYSFIYTPSDKTRKIKDVFVLKPAALIKWGDKRLEVTDVRQEDKRLHAKVLYHLLEFQYLNREAWSSSAIAVSSGMGTGNIFKGSAERRVSFKNAVKDAVRNYLRPRIYNKPREVSGEVIVWNSPEVTVNDGMYVTTVRIKIRIKKVVPYRIF